jgi:hypothetical protein
MLRRESQIVKLLKKASPLLVALCVIIVAGGCGGRAPVSYGPRLAVQETKLARMGYSIQVGAFSHLDNAARLTALLEGRGLNAYYFVHETGLYKVRFGDFPSKETARAHAESIRVTGAIDEYYIVSPDDYAVVKQRKYGQGYLRDSLVETAKRFVGVPYRWGGSTPAGGFDCSGLTQAVYQLNGLNLPRSSKIQYQAGVPIKRSQLSRGDLVFFATSGGRTVSHVGIYIDRNRFIHAPGRGKRIRTERLSSRYFKTMYVGARTYLQ